MALVNITARHVLLFIPNLIGYFRVVCTLISLTLMISLPSSSSLSLSSSSSSSSVSKDDTNDSNNNYNVWWHMCAMSLYILSFVADLIDGWAARKFQQSSQFGGMLDMITDRCSTLGLLYVLGTTTTTTQQQYQQPQSLRATACQLTFLALMILDISSHWCQMYSTCLVSQGHHKSRSSNSGRNILVQWYYHYYWFFGYLCVGAEFTYIFTYLLRHLEQQQLRHDQHWWWSASYTGVLLAWYACVPGCVLKQIVNVAQLSSACHALARFDALQIHRDRESKDKLLQEQAHHHHHHNPKKQQQQRNEHFHDE